MSRGRPAPNIEGMYSLKVDNISYQTTPHDLRRLFEKYGEIGDIHIPQDRYTRANRGFGFVRFLARRDAEYAMERLDGRYVDGRELRIALARYERPIDERGGFGSRGGGGGGGGRGRGRSRSRSPRRSRSRSPRDRGDRGSPERGGRRRSRSRSASPRRDSRSPSPKKEERASGSPNGARDEGSSRGGSPPANGDRSPAANGSRSPSRERSRSASRSPSPSASE